jgi:hypothetical protein
VFNSVYWKFQNLLNIYNTLYPHIFHFQCPYKFSVGLHECRTLRHSTSRQFSVCILC